MRIVMLRKLALALVVMFVGALAAVPAWAAQYYWTPLFVDQGTCGPTLNMYVLTDVSWPTGPYTNNYWLTNLRTGTQTFSTDTNLTNFPGFTGQVSWRIGALQSADSNTTDQFLIHFIKTTAAGSPIWDVEAILDCGTGAVTILLPVETCGINDGRINPESCPGPVALYCTDNGLEVWDIDADGVGTLAFTFSGSFGTPTTNSLLMKSGDIELWQLDTGEFQVNADQGEGKTYAFVFNGCPYDGNGYNANIDPNE